MRSSRPRIEDLKPHSTHSCTAVHALQRIYGEDRVYPSNIVLHVVGADHREGTTVKQIRTVFEKLFDHLVLSGEVSTLNLVLCGPNIDAELHEVCTSFEHRTTEPESSSMLVVALKCDSGLYHECFKSFLRPHVVFMFNAGLWGYDDWTPTLDVLLFSRESCQERDLSKTVLVVTSYCPEEAEDDMDAVERIVQNHQDAEHTDDRIHVKWLWTPELNPGRSLIERESQCAQLGRKLFENHSWQAVRRRDDDETS